MSNRRIEKKIVYCPNCNTDLECWGYMINGTINCQKCHKQFILTEEIWEKSYDEVIHFCKICNEKRCMRILKHTENSLLLQCIFCKENESISL